MIKNTAGQTIDSPTLHQTADPTAVFAGTVTVYITGDNGVQAIGSVGSGICTGKGRGKYTYLPSQAETNYNIIDFTFTGTGCITESTMVATSVQTGDSYALLGTPANGTVSADIAQIEGQVNTMFTTPLVESYNTDGSPPTVAQALFVVMQMLTEMNITGTTVTVRKLNGSATGFICTLNDPDNPTSITRTS